MGNLLKGPWGKNHAANVSQDDSNEYVVIDTETTGLFKKDRIVEIACVVFKNGKMLEEWSTLVNPNRDLGPTHIHKITPSMVSIAPTFEEISNDLLRLLNGRIIVCHNASFDVRMLRQEFERIAVTVDFGSPFCTMVASRQVLPTGLDNLSDACQGLGIELAGVHSALGDARMTMALFGHVVESEQETHPAICAYDSNQNPTPTVQRKIFERKTDDAIGRIRAFTKKVPFPTTDQKEVAYLLLLNMAMDDLVISPEESTELQKWAEELKITNSRLNQLHMNYFESFVQSALRDGIISEVEREVLTKIANALNLVVDIPQTPTILSGGEDALNAGSKICFTGTAITPNGKQIARAELEAMASRVGLFPVSAVTKKGCDILVAADEASMSGKAQKAREWGIHVISVEKFITLCTFG
jgi:DNA polymerase-3 subunit epsilon